MRHWRLERDPEMTPSERPGEEGRARSGGLLMGDEIMKIVMLEYIRFDVALGREKQLTVFLFIFMFYLFLCITFK